LQARLEVLLRVSVETIKDLRKIVKLRIPQKEYAIVSRLMNEGWLIQKEFEENDILIEIEIPAYLEHKVKPFMI
jgi:GTP-binding protein HflX